MDSKAETIIQCSLTPYCTKIRCQQKKHHELLEFLAAGKNFTKEDQRKKLDKLIHKYEAQGWKREDPINDPEPVFCYPLFHWASALAKTSVVKFLVSEGFNPNALTSQKDTPFHRAIACLGSTKSHKPYYKHLESLLNVMPYNITVANNLGQTPLLLLTDMMLKVETTLMFFSEGVRVIVECAMKQSADNKHKALNTQNKDGNTALHLMVQEDGVLPDIKRLVEAKCKLSITNNNGLTALFLAEELNKMDYVQVLRKHMPACMSRRFIAKASPVDKVNDEMISPSRKRHRPLRESDSENTGTCLTAAERRKQMKINQEKRENTNEDNMASNKGNESSDTHKISCHENRDSTESPGNGTPNGTQSDQFTNVEESQRNDTPSDSQDSGLENVNTDSGSVEEINKQSSEGKSSVPHNLKWPIIKIEAEDKIPIIPNTTDPCTCEELEMPSLIREENEMRIVQHSSDELADSGLLQYISMNPSVKNEIKKILEMDNVKLQASYKETENEVKELAKEDDSIFKEQQECQKKVIELLKQVESEQLRLSDFERKRTALEKLKAKSQEKLEGIGNKLQVLGSALEKFE